MTTAPAADQIRLLEVQRLDTKLDQLAHRRCTLPVHDRLATLEELAAQADAAVVTARTAVSDLTREVAKAEADVEQVRSRAARDQARLDSGQASVKDVQALSSELETLARRQSALEDVELEVMERLETAEAELADAEQQAAAVVAELTEATTERDGETAAIDGEAGEVAAARATAVEGIDTGLVTLYERLRADRGGIGAAALRGSRCEGCHLDLNASEVAAITKAEADEVVRCEECGRILVREAG